MLNNSSHDAGFTLIEVMVAMLIISVSLLALAGLLISTIKHNQGSEQRMDVAMVAQSVLSDCKARRMAGASDCTAVTSPRSGYAFILTLSGTTPNIATVSLQGSRMGAPFIIRAVIP